MTVLQVVQLIGGVFAVALIIFSIGIFVGVTRLAIKTLQKHLDKLSEEIVKKFDSFSVELKDIETKTETKLTTVIETLNEHEIRLRFVEARKDEHKSNGT